MSIFLQLRKYLPNLFEFLTIIVLGILPYLLIVNLLIPVWAIKLVVLLFCFVKTAWFVYETSKQVLVITRLNLPYHRFLWMLGINMIQIIFSFSVDFFLLQMVDLESFNGVTANKNIFYQLFDFFYFSCLNFSFFGFGDITPNRISAKLVTLTEVLLAFASVVFVLSDFVTLKESLRKK